MFAWPDAIRAVKKRQTQRWASVRAERRIVLGTLPIGVFPKGSDITDVDVTMSPTHRRRFRTSTHANGHTRCVRSLVHVRAYIGIPSQLTHLFGRTPASYSPRIF
jgi:hypothetical protein